MRQTARVLTLDDLPDVMNVRQAAEACHVHNDTIIRHIQDGRLAAFMPMGRAPRSPGRGMGYRIHKKDLQRWFFGTPE